MQLQAQFLYSTCSHMEWPQIPSVGCLAHLGAWPVVAGGGDGDNTGLPFRRQDGQAECSQRMCAGFKLASQLAHWKSCSVLHNVTELSRSSLCSHYSLAFQATLRAFNVFTTDVDRPPGVQAFGSRPARLVTQGCILEAIQEVEVVGLQYRCSRCEAI